jgi:hypothetical protein
MLDINLPSGAPLGLTHKKCAGVVFVLPYKKSHINLVELFG